MTSPVWYNLQDSGRNRARLHRANGSLAGSGEPEIRLGFLVENQSVHNIRGISPTI
jgi:hypothetical protein